MRHPFILVFFSFIAFSMNAQQTDSLKAPQAKIIKFADLEALFNIEGDQLYVINFWATWCRPCVKELPYFDEVQAEFGDKIKVILVSLDFVEDYESRLIPFMKMKKPQAEVMLLDETKYNTWIDKVSKEWSGAIPATIFVQKSRQIRQFEEGEFEHGELNTLISKILKE